MHSESVQAEKSTWCKCWGRRDIQKILRSVILTQKITNKMKEALTNSSQKKSVPTIEEVDDQSKRTTKAMKDQLKMTQYG